MLFCFCIDVVYMFSPVSVSLFFYRTLTTLVFIFFVSVSGLLCASTFLRLFSFFLFFFFYEWICISVNVTPSIMWVCVCDFLLMAVVLSVTVLLDFVQLLTLFVRFMFFLCVYFYYFNINVFCCYMFRYLFCCFLKIFKQLWKLLQRQMFYRNKLLKISFRRKFVKNQGRFLQDFTRRSNCLER